MSVFSKIANDIAKWPAAVDSCSARPQADPKLIRDWVGQVSDFTTPRRLEDVYDDVYHLLREGTVHPTHPRHFGLFTPSVTTAGITADMLTALFNPNLAAWWYAPAACEIEKQTLTHFVQKIGYRVDDCAAHFTSGGSEANFTAVLTALTARWPDHGEQGLVGATYRPAIYVSREAHDSFSKIAHALGIGRQAVRRVATDERCRMDINDLAKAIDKDSREGWTPFLIVATVGTTAMGAIDPLPELVNFSQARGLWLHVDAAWGGLALLSRTCRDQLRGIANSDSVTWDAHKCLPIPMGAGMFFCRHKQAVRSTFRVETAYVPPSFDDTEDPYQASMLWSRRCTGLKVFMTLAEQGEMGIAAMIDHQVAMAELLRTSLTQSGWILGNDTRLPLVCFTHATLEKGLVAPGALVNRVLTQGRAWISLVNRPDGRALLRACITNHQTNERDIQILVDELNAAFSHCYQRSL